MLLGKHKERIQLTVTRSEANSVNSAASCDEQPLKNITNNLKSDSSKHADSLNHSDNQILNNTNNANNIMPAQNYVPNHYQYQHQQSYQQQQPHKSQESLLQPASSVKQIFNKFQKQSPDSSNGFNSKYLPK